MKNRSPCPQRSPMTRLDDTDREILNFLRDDARTPVLTLAQRLRVSRGMVQNRMDKMQAGGVIMGYTVRLRPDFDEPQHIRGWTSIAVDGKAVPEVIRVLRSEPMVGALHSTSGRWDIVAELRAKSLEAFDAALGRIRLTPGIANTETSILLSTYKA